MVGRSVTPGAAIDENVIEDPWGSRRAVALGRTIDVYPVRPAAGGLTIDVVDFCSAASETTSDALMATRPTHVFCVPVPCQATSNTSPAGVATRSYLANALGGYPQLAWESAAHAAYAACSTRPRYVISSCSDSVGNRSDSKAERNRSTV